MEKNKMTDKKFTWADLKKIVNKLPAHLLKSPVIGWHEDSEAGIKIVYTEKLKEHYVFDGDEGCAPINLMKKEDDYDPEDNYIVHPKGTIILIYV
jgi:hypothetical protein